MPDRSPSRDGLRLWTMVAAHAADRGRRVSVADACAVAASAAHVSGAGLTVMTRADSGRVVCVTDDVSARVEELQVTLGEGPCVDAYASRAPVLTPDLRGQQALRRWPAFAPAAKEVGAAAVYAFPLQMGAVRLGVMDLYHREPRSLASDELRDALVLADTATMLLLGGESRSRRLPRRRVGGPAQRAGGVPGGDRPGDGDGQRPDRRERRGGVPPAARLRVCRGP